MPRSVEKDGWRVWVDENPAPCGWAAAEFDILMQYDAPVALIQRIWGRDRAHPQNFRTTEKRVNNWKQEHGQST